MTDDLPPFLSHEHPIALSHRGGAGLWPENTMEAFSQSYDLGYRYFETDLHLTADGTLVLMHDDALQRTTDGTGLVNDWTLAELKRLDAGYWFMPQQDYPYRGQGIEVPTLEEALTTYPDCYFTLEMKQGGMSRQIASVIRKHDLWDRVLVAGFRDPWVWRVRRETGGRVATSAPRWEIGAFLACSRIRRGLKLAASTLQVPPRHKWVQVVDELFVAAAHAAGKHVHVWTVDDPERMNWLLDLGVDGIMTDRPDVLKEVMIERGRGGPWNG